MKIWLIETSKERRGQILNLTDWKCIENPAGTPQQQGATDCGVFIIKFAEFIARGKKLEFTQSHMGLFRRQMTLQICGAALDFTPKEMTFKK